MNKKRIIASLAAVAVVATLFAGCKKTETAKPETGTQTKTESKIKIGLSTDEGGLNDKSFNQSADTGVKKAVKEFGLDYKAIESTKKEDYQSNLEALVGAKSDLTFAIGFQMEEAMKAISTKYKDKNFAIIDSVVEAPNVQSIVFKENEGSFLMGVIAGKMTKTNKVGFIGGKDFELINRFEAGYAAGVKAVNPAAAEDLISRKTVKYADSFGDVNKGYELAKALYNDGCDIVFHAAGGVGIGMFKATKEFRDAKKDVWAIGVDMDQAITVPEYANIILSSMIKRVDIGTYNACAQVAKKEFKGGVVQLGIKENGVGIPDYTSETYTSKKTPMNTPADVLEVVKKYQAAIKDGKIVVPAKTADVKAFTPAAL